MLLYLVLLALLFVCWRGRRVAGVMCRRARGATLSQAIVMWRDMLRKLCVALHCSWQKFKSRSLQISCHQCSVESRPWLATRQSESGGDRELRVMTYNVLAPCHTRPHLLRFPYCDAEHLDWRDRLARIAGDVAKVNADVVCMQEVQLEHFGSLRDRMNALGYDGRAQYRTGARVVEGCATFHRRQRVEPTMFVDIDLDRVAADACDDARDRGFLQGSVAQLARFRFVVDDDDDDDELRRTFSLCNVHVVNLWQRSAIQRFQVASLIEHCKQTLNGNEVDLLCGDFNTQPGMPLHAMIVDTKNMKSAYASVAGSEPFATNYTVEFCGCLDYAFVSSNSKLRAAAALQTPSRADIGEQPPWLGWPNSVIASDHIPLAFDFVFD
jgi:CCR4-NOT transcription complex subunit 6